MGFKKTTSTVSSFITADTDTTNIAPIHAPQKRAPGTVYLVGAGPGDADLLTVKALSLIQQCDVIIFDNLVSKEIRLLFPEQALSVYVGKSKGSHHFTQSKINQLLADKARQGLNVCRLKGGDAFVFGRGGEEMIELKKQGIQVEIVPGITAAAGCGSYAGIPLTHRGLSQGCTFVTAHAEKELDINWSALAELDHTLVFYMGLSKVPLIEKQLTAAGLSKDTPAAIIENGCCPEQRLITGQLNQLASLVTKEQVKSPALIMIGKVVSLSQQLQWFNSQSGINSTANELSRISA
ncbi:uroporphyrinogen-III C-methyltransferase [Psychromonas aquimarina]|uniref:uroporphyrinogen-III C-methyltransferase n=1 Tax=Psychromonas aquimarina TaxID=444919 RepID=UPI0009FCB2A8|nr:uroporphyrinogen-III C-methyltransferase [Psychromonas aquimarina]